MPERKIRIRRKKSAGVVTPKKKLDELEELAKDTETMMAEVMELNEKIKKNEQKLHASMLQYFVDEVPSTYGVFKNVIPKGRSSTVIPVPALYERMDLDDFLACVKPMVTEVKKHFSPKEMQGISTTEAGQDGHPTLVYKPHKK